VVEVEVEDTAFVAADSAASAGLCNEDSLDLLMTSRDRFADATLAAPAVPWLARPVEMEHDVSEPLAAANLSGAVRRRRTARLLQQWDGRLERLRRHEHMFACTSDRPPAILSASGR
jgi:hypothetical protein